MPMNPYFHVDRDTKHSDVITARVTKVMFSPVVGKALKEKKSVEVGIRSILRLCLREAWGKP